MRFVSFTWPLLIAGALILGGCAGDDEEEVVVSPLPSFKARFEPEPLWTAQINTTIGEDIAISASDLWHWAWPWAGYQSKDDRPTASKVPSDLQPIWYNNAYYVVNKEGLLIALDAEGKVKFRRWLGTRISGGLSAAANLLFVGTPEGEMLALDAENGDEKWRNLVSSEIIAPAAIAEGKVIVRCVDGKLFALSIDTGERKWFVDRNVPALTQRGTSTPVIVSGMVIAGFDNGKVSAFRLEDGRELWEKRVSQPTGRSEIERIADIDADPIVFGSSLYVASFNGSVMAIDLRNGETVWQREMSTYRSMGIDAQMLFVASAKGDISAIDRRNGFVLWTQKSLENRYLTAPVAMGDYVVVGDSEGYLHYLKRDDGSFIAGIHIDNNGFQAPPLVINDRLVIYGRGDKLLTFAAPQENTTDTFIPYGGKQTTKHYVYRK